MVTYTMYLFPSNSRTIHCVRTMIWWSVNHSFVSSLENAVTIDGNWGISLHVRSGVEPRIGNVSWSLGRNTIIALNDSIETLIDGVAVRDQPDHAFAVSQIRCTGELITYEYLSDRTILLEPDGRMIITKGQLRI